MRAPTFVALSALAVAAARSALAAARNDSALGNDTWWHAHVRHLVFVHGFARSGSTLVGKQLRDAAGGQACWVGKTLSAEAQMTQTVYASWHTNPLDPRNADACADAWANATTYETKRRALRARVGDRVAAARNLLAQWRLEGAVNVAGLVVPVRAPPGGLPTRDCGTWVAKDPRLDTLDFLPWLFRGVVPRTTSVVVARHPYQSLYLSEHGGGPCKPRRFGAVLGQWFDAWRRALGGLANSSTPYCVVRMEDLLLDEANTRSALAALVDAPPSPPPRTRRLRTIHGTKGRDHFKVDASYAFNGESFALYAREFAKVKRVESWGASKWIFEHFGYDLREPSNLGPGPGAACLFSAARPPPAEMLATWPTWPGEADPYDQRANGRITADMYHCRGFRRESRVRARPRLDDHMRRAAG